MLFSRVKSVEDYIVEVLGTGDKTAPELLEGYSRTEKMVTMQAVYKILQKLRDDGVVVKYQNLFSLSNTWKNKVVSLLRAEDAIPVLQEGESIQYNFKSLDQLDHYWKHVHAATEDSESPMYLYGGHQFWWLMPKIHQSEIDFYQNFSNKKRKGMLLIGFDSLADKETKKELQSDYVQVHCEANHNFNMTESGTVQDDFIVQTKISARDSNAIHHIYKQNLSLADTKREFEKLLEKPIAARITIERNAKKAEKMRKEIGKYFY